MRSFPSSESRSFLVFARACCCSRSFIWFAGPYFAFADYPAARVGHSLASSSSSLVVGVVAGVAAAETAARVSRSDRLSPRSCSRPWPKASRSSAEAAQLRERFEEAVATLKQRRRSGHSLYELPWYVIIGAPGSGKTTALVNSGLKFPLEQRVGKGRCKASAARAIATGGSPTKRCFSTPPAATRRRIPTRRRTAPAWAEFLALLRKYRKRRPINGVILTISAARPDDAGRAGREEHVEAARHRLIELNRELRIQLPVYLMVTKCDLVAGFTEYFDDLTQEARAQVWGVTFPYEQTLKGEAAQALPGGVRCADGAAQRTRCSRGSKRIATSRRRAKIFAFPQQMAALREPLAQFVDGSVCVRRASTSRSCCAASTSRAARRRARRSIGCWARSAGGFGVAPERSWRRPGRGKAYFVERLLKEVLIGESGLAGVNRRLEVQKAAMQLGAYAAMAAARRPGRDRAVRQLRPQPHLPRRQVAG